MDALLSCLCGACVICQNANEVGEKAVYSAWTLADLLKPPTVQDLKTEMSTAVGDAK